MRCSYGTFIFGVVLYTDVERVVFKFQGFHQMCFGVDAGWQKATFFKFRLVVTIKFVSVAVSFGNLLGSVNIEQLRLWF